MAKDRSDPELDRELPDLPPELRWREPFGHVLISSSAILHAGFCSGPVLVIGCRLRSAREGPPRWAPCRVRESRYVRVLRARIPPG